MEFKYKAKTQNEEITEGVIEAPNESVAVDTLQSKGYIVLSVSPIKKDLFSADLNQIFSRPNNKDIVIFTRQLSTLIDADMPIAEGLRTLAQQVEKPALRKIITGVSDAVEAGSSLSNALSAYPKLFTPFYIKLVQSGEVSGKLHETLLYLADYLERSQSINSKIRGALAYPAFVMFALVVVMLIMVVYVLPQLLSIFKEAGMENLPITTRALMFITDFVNKYIILILVAIIGIVFASYSFIKTPKGKDWLDRVKISVPSLGSATKNLYLARIAETLSTLIKSGIPILDSLKITADLVGNSVYRRILNDAEENVRGGGSMSEIFYKYKDMPPLLSSMVAIGEKTGKLDAMLQHVSKFYKEESEQTIQTIAQLIEPIMVLILGLAVGILVSAILLPIYNLVGAS